MVGKLYLYDSDNSMIDDCLYTGHMIGMYENKFCELTFHFSDQTYLSA